MKIVNHQLLDARQVVSPNFNERPADQQPELIVVHCISLPPGEFSGRYIEAFFQNQLDTSIHPYFAEIAEMKVSAHLLIRRNGEIIQFVPFNKRAWHAGDSCYGDRVNCNDFSVGIELEGTDDGQYEAEQYQCLAEVIAALCNAYPALTSETITGHSDIAPHRKTDPGPGFNWGRLKALLEAQ